MSIVPLLKQHHVVRFLMVCLSYIPINYLTGSCSTIT